MTAIAIIPARGGSKRLPRKNIASFLGQPIIAYTVHAALSSECFEKVVVSTDDDEIAAAAATAGAQVENRAAHLSSDEARVVDVCLSLLDTEELAGRSYDVMACLYATAPLRTAEDVRSVVALVIPGQVDFAMAVTDYELAPHQALREGSDGRLVPVWPDIVNLRASDIGVIRVDNGSTYAVSVPAFKQARSFYGPSMKGHFMPRMRSVDIDQREDLVRAEFYARQLLK